MNWPYW